MRFPTVDEQGTYQKKVLSDAASNVSHITMMQVRAYIIHESYKISCDGMHYGDTLFSSSEARLCVR